MPSNANQCRAIAACPNISPACIARWLDLLVHSPHQMVCRNIPKRLIVHQANENFFIAVHPLNKQVFKLFVLNTGAKFSMLLAITASTTKGFAGSDPFFVFRCAREVRMARWSDSKTSLVHLSKFWQRFGNDKKHQTKKHLLISSVIGNTLSALKMIEH